MQAVEESSCVKSLLLPFLYHLFFHLRKQIGSCLAVDCKGGFSRLCFGIHVEIGKCWKAEKLPSSSGKIGYATLACCCHKRLLRYEKLQ